jgi:hypothetical protein
MFSIVNRSPRRCNAFPPTATTIRFFPFGIATDDDDEEEAEGLGADEDADVADVVAASADAVDVFVVERKYRLTTCRPRRLLLLLLLPFRRPNKACR